MFGIKLSRKYREMEKLLSRKNEEILSLKKRFNALQSDIATLMEVQEETHRHYGQLLLQQMDAEAVRREATGVRSEV